MPSEDKRETAEDEVLAWKKRRAERQRKKQQERAEKEDDFAALAGAMDGERNQHQNQNQNEIGSKNADNDDENDDENDDDNDVYVPLAKRKKLEKEALIGRISHRRRHLGLDDAGHETARVTTDAGGDEARTNSDVNNKNDDNDNDDDNEGEKQADPKKVESLLDSATALHDALTEEERAEKLRGEEEARIMKEASKVQTNALKAASELASGIDYSEPMPSTWSCPRYILDQGEAVWEAVRKEWHMECEGVDIPPPCKRFVDMKLALPILEVLKRKGIKKPTPIQMQGLTVALAGRDLIGIAFTGSGKTLTFGLPLVTVALEEELRMPLAPGEGPVGIILAPSRELVRQTYEVVVEFCDEISKTQGYPEIRTQLVIGGESVRDQLETLQARGIHCVVATPGRLRDILKRKAMKLDNCRYIALDEADRLLDLGFDEELAEIMNNFGQQRQNLLFSVRALCLRACMCLRVYVPCLVRSVGGL